MSMNVEPDFFDRLVWKEDRMMLDELVFRLEHFKNDETWELGDSCFRFVKTKGLVEEYEDFFTSRKKEFDVKNIFELGTWDGGSVAFWSECFRPTKHVSIDRSRKGDSEYFKQYVKSRGAEDRVKTYWGVNQADADQLRKIVKSEFSAPLDLVIDDASHMYDLTKASFEALFPFLRPGGLYIIEDWAWAHWKNFDAPAHWSLKTEPTKLIFELAEATGTSKELISSLIIMQGFMVVERAQTELPVGFKLDEHIYRRRKGIVKPRSLLATLSSMLRLLRWELDRKSDDQSL